MKVMAYRMSKLIRNCQAMYLPLRGLMIQGAFLMMTSLETVSSTNMSLPFTFSFPLSGTLYWLEEVPKVLILLSSELNFVQAKEASRQRVSLTYGKSFFFLIASSNISSSDMGSPAFLKYLNVCFEVSTGLCGSGDVFTGSTGLSGILFEFLPLKGVVGAGSWLRSGCF